MDYHKKDLILWFTAIVGVTTVCCFGINALDNNSTQINEIEKICYDHGGHMAKAPYAASYMTCFGQTR